VQPAVHSSHGLPAVQPFFSQGRELNTSAPRYTHCRLKSIAPFKGLQHLYFPLRRRPMKPFGRRKPLCILSAAAPQARLSSSSISAWSGSTSGSDGKERVGGRGKRVRGCDSRKVSMEICEGEGKITHPVDGVLGSYGLRSGWRVCEGLVALLKARLGRRSRQLGIKVYSQCRKRSAC
jgi:hypothetical protein